MIWHPQRLPISLPPVGGESLDSWIEAYARRLRASSRDLLDHLGLTGHPLAHLLTTLREPERQILSTAAGIDPQVLTGMTLQPFDGVAVNIDTARRVTVHPPAWRRQTGSRYCPACLHDNGGRWLLAWRLPWTFACPIHTRLLLDYCPGCGNRPRPHRSGTRHQASVAGRCTAALPTTGGWRSQTCGHPLTTASTVELPAAGRVLAAAGRIDHLLAAAVATADPGRRSRIGRVLGELHALAYKGLDAVHIAGIDPPPVVHRILDECGGTIPAPLGPLDSHDARTIALATAIAAAAHQDDPTGEQVLSWIITADRRRRAPAEPGRILSPWKHAGPALTARLLTALDPHLQAHDRFVYASASTYPGRPDATSQQIRRRAASLPAMLWPAWAIRLIPTSTTAHNTLIGTRAGLSAMTLLSGTRLTTAQAIARLGAPTSSAAANHTITRLPEPQRTACIAILTDLAHALDAVSAPIDYIRRRALFSRCRVDRRGAAALAMEHRWRPPSPLQLRILDEHLAVLLTGTHPDQHTSQARWSAADAWNPLTLALPPPVRGFVHDQARHLLHQQHIDEPVSWHPTPPANIRWPGIDPDTIDANRFAAAFATHATARRSLARICQATGLSGLQVRLYTQIVELPMPDHHWDALAEHPGHGVGDPATLQHLYHDQRMSMMDIARRSLTTQRVVRRALTNAGTTLQAQRPRTRPVPPAWFQQHYLNTGKTMTQAAADAGVSRNTLHKYARLHNIPTGPRASAINPFANWPADQQPPREVISACRGSHGITYVRQVLQMPGHPTRRAAAAALGLHEHVLCRHRQHVERAAGIRIFRPDPPLTPTPEGERFLHHAAQALQRLDQTASGKS